MAHRTFTFALWLALAALLASSAHAAKAPEESSSEKPETLVVHPSSVDGAAFSSAEVSSGCRLTNTVPSGGVTPRFTFWKTGGGSKAYGLGYGLKTHTYASKTASGTTSTGGYAHVGYGHANSDSYVAGTGLSIGGRRLLNTRGSLPAFNYREAGAHSHASGYGRDARANTYASKTRSGHVSTRGHSSADHGYAKAGSYAHRTDLTLGCSRSANTRSNAPIYQEHKPHSKAYAHGDNVKSNTYASIQPDGHTSTHGSAHADHGYASSKSSVHSTGVAFGGGRRLANTRVPIFTWTRTGGGSYASGKGPNAKAHTYASKTRFGDIHTHGYASTDHGYAKSGSHVDHTGLTVTVPLRRNE